MGVRELDQRSAAGIDVRLVWRPVDDSLYVTVGDALTGETFHMDVEPLEAMDVFEHPFAYAARLELAVA